MNQTELIALAGLLHDIGKFWMRTGQERPYTRDEEGEFCPSGRDGRPTRQHVLWGGHFVERFVGDPQVADSVFCHHKPSTRENWIVSLADCLASGERVEDEDVEPGDPWEAPLQSIFTALKGRPSTLPRQYFPLSRHLDWNGFFPADEISVSQDDYRNLWEKFTQAISAYPGGKIQELATWFYLLRRFASRVPAATPTRVERYRPDISLFTTPA